MPKQAKGKSSASHTKKPTKKRASTAKKKKAQQARGVSPQQRQQIALILFVTAVFLIFLICVSGEKLWLGLHNVVLGLFGHSAILWPILLLYIAITISFEKSLRSITGKLWLCAALICMVSSTFFFFTYSDNGLPFWNQLGALYTDGYTRHGSGLLSGLVGIPLVRAFGLTGAKIVGILLDFLLLMLLTGTGLAQLMRWIAAPAKAVGKTASDLMNEPAPAADAEADSHRKRSAIDIPLDGDDEAAAPPAPLSRPKESRKQNAGPETLSHNPKFEQLHEAFNGTTPTIANYEPDAVEPEMPADTSAPTEAPAAPVLIQPASEEDEAGLSSAMRAIEQMEQPAPEAKSAPAEETPDAQNELPAERLDPNQSTMIPDAEPQYRFPPITLLEEDKPLANRADNNALLQATGERLIATLKSFGVSATILNISQGPAVTRYELQPAAGVKISRITNLADDIALNLAAAGVRIEAPIPNKAAIGIEIPNRQTSVVHLRGLVDSNAFAQAKSRLTVALGRDITGNITLADLAKMPHLLIAGSTGSGKSVCINTMIVSLLYKSTPEEVRFLMVDPKVVELGVYNGIPHLLVPVVTDPRKAAGALNWAVGEMLARYKTFADTGVRDLPAYNHYVAKKQQEDPACTLKPMHQIVIIVDELADLMMAAPNEVEDAICRLAQMARAAGMHLVIATQRPSVDVITGVIKANIPSRIAFAVSSQVDSRTILDASGAEKLLGRGDMLFAPIGAAKPTRVQGCFVSEEEIEQVVSFIKKSAECEYDKEIADEIERRAVTEKNTRSNEHEAEEEDTDPMLDDAVKCVTEAGQASTSLLQRKLRLGYARAGRLIDEMEMRGVVGPHEGSKPRQVLMSYAQWQERNRPRVEDES